MERTNKLLLSIVTLITAVILGGFYYASQVSKQNSIEKQQQIEIEQKQKEQSDKEVKALRDKVLASQALDICISNAEQEYSDQWFSECESLGKLTEKCTSLYKSTEFEWYKEKKSKGVTENLSTADYYKELNECTCRLPLEIADRITKKQENDKNECFRRYPQQ